MGFGTARQALTLAGKHWQWTASRKALKRIRSYAPVSIGCVSETKMRCSRLLMSQLVILASKRDKDSPHCHGRYGWVERSNACEPAVTATTVASIISRAGSSLPDAIQAR